MARAYVTNTPTHRYPHIQAVELNYDYYLKVIYCRSFAYYTFRVRLPSTLATIADSLVKDKDVLLATYGAVGSCVHFYLDLELKPLISNCIPGSGSRY